MPDHAGFVEEGGGFEGRRWNAGDWSGYEEELGGDLAELGVFFGDLVAEIGRLLGADLDGISEVDAGVPEAVAELPEVELG